MNRNSDFLPTDPPPIEDLIRMRLPEAETRQWLLTLTPERITPDLLDRLVATVREVALPVPIPEQPVIDCCGTGGSGLPHYNTSTTAAFILAAGGVPVVKFGNRALSSQSGSFDFLEALGIPVGAPVEALPEILADCGLAFLYAPQCYPCLAPFNQLRRSVSVRTVFNFLGPLLNPVQPAWRLLGVSHAGMQTVMADHLVRQSAGLKRAWLVHGLPDGIDALSENGLDEMAADGVTRILDVMGSEIRESRLERLLKRDAGATDLSDSADPTQNAAIFQALVQGEDSRSTVYEAVCLNAGAGFYVAGHVASLEAGIALARNLLLDKAVKHTWEQCRRVYARF